MALIAGTRLGPYEIIDPLGAGGMGEVYRARDTKLDRDVAIKVLPASLGDDPEALARFEREAKSVATLSHPNILGIFDFGRTAPAEGDRSAVTYAVMELLEGETLRDRLAAAPLPPRKAIDYAVQIARGLAAAHGRGFVHRDLKPENLFVTVDDRLKILDFGLAKPLDLGTSAATMASSVPTAVGTVMGTIGYMAPEQLRGHAVDHRSDIFAFGAVLHEMLTGRRAFPGDSPADTISAILHRDPPELDADGAGVPPALERIVRRCLEKKPELRFQSAHDLAFALETLSGSRSGAAAVAPQERTTVQASPRLPWAIAAGAVIVAAAAIAFNLRAPSREPPWQKFTAVTDAAGIETAPSLSPDGATVAYATRAQGTWDVYVQRVGGRRALPIAADVERDEQAPAFSPDGSFIAYHDRGTSGGIFVAGATGESSRRLTDFGFHPSWSPDGRRIAFGTEEIGNPYSRLGDSALWVVEVSGGAPQQVKGTGDAAQPSWSPSGDRIAYWSNTAGQRDIYTVPAAGGTRVALTDDAALDWDPAWSPDGRYVYFASDRGGSMNLWRAPVDERSGNADGDAEPVTIGVQASSEMASLSGNGARLALRSTVLAINPVAIALDPVTLKAGSPTVLSNSNSVRFPSDMSPDGRSLALANLGEPQEDLFIGAPDGTGVRRLTDDPARDRVPVFAPDGKSLFFYSNRDGDYGIWSVGVDGGGLRKVAQGLDIALLYPVVSPDGSRLVASAGATGEGVFLLQLSPRQDTQRQPAKLPATRMDGDTFTATDWSPDGTKLAGYLQGAAGVPVAVAIYDLAAEKIASRFPHPTGYVRWMRDNRRVGFFATGGKRFVVLDTTTGQAQPLQIDLPLRDAGESFALAPDGRTIYYGGRREEADIWIVERK